MDTYVENIKDIVPYLYNKNYVDMVEDKVEVAEK